MRAFLAALLLAATTARAAPPTFYATRVAFDAAHPGMPVQSFDSANLGGQTYVTQPNKLSARTSDAVFGKGSIRPGLSLRTLHPGSQASALIVYAGGPVGATSVGNNWYGDTLVLRFRPGVTAVAENVFANTSAGTSFAGKITEKIVSGPRTLATRSFTEPAGGYVFVGVSATDPITAVELTWASDNDASTFASEIAFGN